jgi:ribosome silencing factor RsfS/YbeB/iojap
MSLEERIERIVQLLDSKKAEEIEVFDLEEVDYIAKRVVIANSLGGKHTQALFDNMKEELKPRGETFYGSDESDDWIVADLGEIIVHLMTPAYRQRYSLESFLEELRDSQAGQTPSRH